MPTSRLTPLTVRTQAAFGAGGVVDQWGMHGLKNLANPVFNIILGVNPALVGTLLALARVWDAVTDPLMGGITDNARTRWGRRRPFIALGAVLCGITFPLMWWLTPGLGSTAQIIWVGGSFLLFYAAFTVFTVPYHALGYELAPNHHDKTRLLAARTLFATVTGFSVGWIFPLTQSGWLGSPQQSVRVLALVIGAAIAIFGLAPALLLRDRTAPELARQEKVPLRRALGFALPSVPFRILLSAATLTIIGLNMVNVLGLYVGVYYVFGGDAKSASLIGGVGHSIHNLVVLVSAPLLTRFSRRIGKRNALLTCLTFALVGSVSKWWFFTPSEPWLQLIVVVLMAPALTGLWMISESMVADVAEYENWRKGVRIEGVFSAIYGWCLKTGLALGVFVSGWILVWSGFDVTLGSDQPPQTLFWLRVYFAAIPAVAITMAIGILFRYPLSSSDMERIRAELEERQCQTPQ